MSPKPLTAIQNLKGWITELGEKRKELLAQKAAEEATLLPNLLMKYMEILLNISTGPPYRNTRK